MRIILEPEDKAELKALARNLEGLGLARVAENEVSANDINGRVRAAVELLQKENVFRHAYDFKWILEVINQDRVKGLKRFDNPESFRNYLMAIGVKDVPSRTTLYDKDKSCRGDFPNLTFTDTKEPTETLRRITVAQRFLSAYNKAI